MSQTKGKYPDAFYRVSIKAIIRNDAGDVMVIREKDSKWNLPGGGIDHGESVHEALTRELYEEALINSEFQEKYVGTTSYFLESKDAWLLWIVYELEFDSKLTFGLGTDAKAIEFMDPAVFKDSEIPYERRIYEMTQVTRQK